VARVERALRDRRRDRERRRAIGNARDAAVIEIAVTVIDLAILFVAAALGGALNSVAGGGSFISFPALLFMGVSPVVANATNTIALWPAGLASAYAYRKDMRAPREELVALGVASAVGGAIGAVLLLKTRESTFVHLIPFLLLLATLLFSFGGLLTGRLRVRGHSTRGALAAATAAQLFISIYGGYFGGGMGIMMLATLSLMGMTEIHAMNALKVLLGILINGVAVALFIVAGSVAWTPGIAMIAGGTLGGFAGAALARRIAPAAVRKFVLVVAWGMTAYFFWRSFAR
jgi:uncharacterized membrane protein YfcA